MKTLKKFARNSRLEASPSGLIFESAICFTRLMSVLKYLGPRNELRPMPGGAFATLGKKLAPFGPKIPVMNASFDVGKSLGPV